MSFIVRRYAADFSRPGSQQMALLNNLPNSPMTIASVVSDLVEEELANYRYERAASDKTLGSPWPETKVRAHIELLRAALVLPYRQAFILRDTPSEAASVVPVIGSYWVVAQHGGQLVFYDETTTEFGLATEARAGTLPATIGVRGDLVGVFCAM